MNKQITSRKVVVVMGIVKSFRTFVSKNLCVSLWMDFATTSSVYLQLKLLISIVSLSVLVVNVT